MKGFDSSLTLQKLEVLCTVVELASVTRAAERLCVAQPVVTAHLRGLEAKLGVKLVARAGRNIALTATGQRVYVWAREVVTRTRELERELVGLEAGAAGSAVIAASMTAGTYLLPDLVTEFHAGRRDGLISVQISNPLAALDSVRTGACDLAVTLVAPGQNLDGLAVQKLGDEALRLVSAPASRLVGRSTSVAALTGLPFVSTPRNLLRRELEDALLSRAGVDSRQVLFEFGHPEAMKNAVRKDLGLCFMLESSVRADLARGELRAVGVRGFAASLPLSLLHRRDKRFSPYQTALVAYLLAQVPRYLGAAPRAPVLKSR